MCRVFDVFVNYRTADAKFGAVGVHDALVRRFGRERVFLDHVSINPGEEYSASILAALEQVRVLVVLIGPGWLEEDSESGVRLVDRERDCPRTPVRS